MWALTVGFAWTGRQQPPDYTFMQQDRDIFLRYKFPALCDFPYINMFTYLLDQFIHLETCIGTSWS